MARTHDGEALDSEDVKRCIAVLEALAQDRSLMATLDTDSRVKLMYSAGIVSRPNRDELRRAAKAFRRKSRQDVRTADRALTAATEIREARRAQVFAAPPQLVGGAPAPEEAPELLRPRNCYVCKAEYRKVHFFYDSMCAACAETNYAKRFQTASLEGRVALITGARIKIGYQAALMMLRAGARVIVTTRFPRDAAERFAREKDFSAWENRLVVYGLDLRYSPSVEAFARHIVNTEERLDILINNAAQTVKRPTSFYTHLLAGERATQQLPGVVHSVAALAVTEDHDHALFPKGMLDADLQQVDLRKENSWRLTLGDVPSAEMLEVQLINAVAPFILCAKLKPLMVRDRTDQKHIVNVSAMEGKFSRHTKTDKHPHTNMAKAALNMMTLTSAPDYAKDGIFMNAVDTGWVTDEDAVHLAQQKTEMHDFQPPLDIVDGAARICDPFFSGLITGEHVWGKFLKDYAPTTW